MKLLDFHYEVPLDAIAQVPLKQRDGSRLMVLDRKNNQIKHERFYSMANLLRPGDVLVLNATKVFPARLHGKKTTGGKIEILLLNPHPPFGHPLPEGRGPTAVGLLPEGEGGRRPDEGIAFWRALVRGTVKKADLVFPEGLKARMTERLAEGEWALEFSSNHIREYLNRHGEMPLPPYIKRPSPRAQDLERYQTVYAETEGAVAAPTAGFHFTPELLDRVRAKGVSVQFITLHVGWGTFRPVRTDTIEAHQMLPESYAVTDDTAAELNRARAEGRRIIAVGTTAVRTLETICDTKGHFQAGQGQSNLFIYPGYRFKGVDALITNFHLPDSTPLLLACAFYGGSPETPFSLRAAYAEAIREGYRFYSYGDAMFIQ